MQIVELGGYLISQGRDECILDFSPDCIKRNIGFKTSLVEQLLVCDPIFCDRKPWRNTRFDGGIEDDHTFWFGRVNSGTFGSFKWASQVGSWGAAALKKKKEEGKQAYYKFCSVILLNMSQSEPWGHNE